MQVCKYFWVNIIFFFVFHFGMALDFPSMPSVSSPSMPEIGGTPYGPWNHSKGPRPTDATTSEPNSTKESVQSIPGSVAGMALSAQNISDIGGLTAIASLTGEESLSEALQAISGGKGKIEDVLQDSAFATSSTNETLNLILEQLQLLATKEKATTSAAKTEVSVLQEAFPQSKILRFGVNGTDILGTCRTIYFSEPEQNGIFLLTGDRVFHVDKQKHTETFFLLFKPRSSENGSFFYDVEVDLLQSPETKGSRLFPLKEIAKLTARRTGNLVTLSYNQTGWNLDMLLDLRGQTK